MRRGWRSSWRVAAAALLLIVVIGVPRAPLPTLGAMPLAHLLRGASPIESRSVVGDTESRVHALLRCEGGAANALDAELVALSRAGTSPAAIVRAVMAIGERPIHDRDETLETASLEPCALDGDFGVAVAVATRANLARLDATTRDALSAFVGAIERASVVAEVAGFLDPRRIELAQRLADAMARGDAPDAGDLAAAREIDDATWVDEVIRMHRAAERARVVLAESWRRAERLGFFTLPPGDAWPRDLVFALRSRAGPILITGPLSSVIPMRGVAAVIDMGGDDVYTDAIGLPGLSQGDPPATLVLDLDGDDDYVGSRGRLGAGIGALGVVVDAAGRDSYEARAPGLCTGILGAAVLVDHGGDDRYDAERVAFGAAAFGTAVLIDVEGDDRYQARGFAFGAASDSGFGAVVDATGYDLVIVAPSQKDADLPCIAVGAVAIGPSGTPGTALWFDRRGDDILRIGAGCGGYADGCGLALAIDLAGDDVVSGGDLCLGAAQNGGFALFRDLAGMDRVVARRRTLGFASDAIAVAVDDGGDDERITLDPGRGARERGGAGVFADLPDESPR